MLKCNESLDRITSTYVEKTDFCSKLVSVCQDHLHIRGENKRTIKTTIQLIGSPPHTWRKLVDLIMKNRGYGITSTYVEKTYLYF